MNALRERLETAIDLWAAGVQLRRQALRREFPAASEAHIDEKLNQWLAQRPGAEFGDSQQPPDRD